MKENNETEYHFLPQLFLRAPHYSFGGYDLSRLPEALLQQDFRNAIWLASPEFYQALAKKDFQFDKLLPKEIHTVYKYYNRICFRPTPFGAFASFTLLNWADGEAVKIGGNSAACIHLLPDQMTLNVVNSLRNNELAAEQLIVNPCLYKVGRLYRYTKSAVTDKNRYEFSLEAIEAVKFHTGLVALFKNKPLPALHVLEWIALRGVCTQEEAMDYLRFLTDEKVLLTAAGGRIIYTSEPSDDTVALSGWKDFWAKHHTAPFCKAEALAGLSAELGTLLEGLLPPQKTQPFYAALEKPHLSGGPGPQEQRELAAAITMLRLLSRDAASADLTSFIKDFKERFDQEKVPLLQALDSDTGVAYGNLNAPAAQPKLLENIRFPENNVQREQTGWTAVHRMLFRLWTGDTLRDPYSPLVLNNTHRKELEEAGDPVSLPQTLALMYRRTGEHVLIESAGGAAATNLIGRFSCFSGSVYELCCQLADKEVKSNPDVVFADIGQLSDAHVDNINRRRRIYPYEIPVNVYSELPVDAQLPPSDLMVSVSGGEVMLESRKLGKRVIPRLATAYNFRHNQLPVFRLLCDLQYQGIRANLTFDLEQFFPGLSFYPRVTFGKTILSLAKWNFKADDLEKLINAADALNELEQFRRFHHLPRYISLGSSDQQLVFDLAHQPEALFFLKCLKRLKEVTIGEYLASGRNVLSGNKPLAGQMIAFLAHGREIYKGVVATKKDHFPKLGRNFYLGSDWLYLKLFCTPRIADELLAKIILPFVSRQRKLIKKWFFIRYTEQGYHLRLRLQANPAKLGTLLVALRGSLNGAGYDQLIRNYHGDTYQREIERYGATLMPLIEDAFCAGSELVANAVKSRAEEVSGWEELKLALYAANGMIRCFLPDEQNRLAFLKRVTDQFIKEFKGNKTFVVELDSKYREVRGLIEGLPHSRLGGAAMRSLARVLKQISETFSNEVGTGRVTLLTDLVHMQLNRTFATRQREQELLVYFILQKQTLSEIARKK
ncbi:thiopeptide-type bacteriocin biosynthesis protein [Mucilaginibacter sp. UYP25]|uniref:lantibiotic dehydratase n=1 Tax=unclassified Mucilaginibacter TaxID=2617802 RepID=UPI003397D9E3